MPTSFRRPRAGVALGFVVSLLTAVTLAAWSVETRQSVRAVPYQIANSFEGPLAYQRAPDGGAYVFDRRGHTVYRIDAAQTSARALVQVGVEEGRILRPSAFDSAPDGSFVLADAPYGKERIQVFNPEGQRIAGFELTGGSMPRITLGSLVLNGIGSLCYTGSTILISRPETGGLITEYDIWGRARRTIGRLRPTGHEEDPELHLALNSGVPLATSDGGFFFVFLAGEPRFRRYTADGTLAFERIIQGRDLDAFVAQLPSTWTRRTIGNNELPLVSPTVRTARVAPDDHLWISLVVPFTYEYDADGEKVRTVQFRGAGLMAPTSLFFASKSRLLVTPGLYEFDMSETKKTPSPP
jgi:hypothetical protein